MLLIRNALSRGGELRVEEDIVYQKGEIKEKKDIPHLNEQSERVLKMDEQTKEIWNAYFKLLFWDLKLIKRVKKLYQPRKKKDEDPGKDPGKDPKTKMTEEELKKLIKKYFPDTTKQLFSGDEVDVAFLLKLLVEKPQPEAKEALIVTKGDSKKTEKETVREAVQFAFNYEGLIGNTTTAPGFRNLVKLLDVNVCPYCGRMFTSTVKSENGDFIRTNQVDHYYPKAVYPFHGLSIWNWIPSCGPCNNHKSDDVKGRFLYPYAEEMGDDYRFISHIRSGVGYLIGKPGSEDEFEICLEPTEACLADKGKRYFRACAEYEIEKLGVRALYSAHGGYIGDIFRQRYVFGDAYQDSLVASFPELFKSRADVRALLYMKSIEAEDIGKAPLDKLTRDIDYEIDTLNDSIF